MGQVKDYLFSFLQLETLLSAREIDWHQPHTLSINSKQEMNCK